MRQMKKKNNNTYYQFKGEKGDIRDPKDINIQ